MCVFVCVRICDGSTRNDCVQTPRRSDGLWLKQHWARKIDVTTDYAVCRHMYVAWCGKDESINVCVCGMFGRMTRPDWDALVLSGRLMYSAAIINDCVYLPRWIYTRWRCVCDAAAVWWLWAVCGPFVKLRFGCALWIYVYPPLHRMYKHTSKQEAMSRMSMKGTRADDVFIRGGTSWCIYIYAFNGVICE